MNGDLATVANNVGTLAKTGYVFAGWNTMADGSGTDYSAGDTLTLTSTEGIELVFKDPKAAATQSK